jgi:hypothetical protein
MNQRPAAWSNPPAGRFHADFKTAENFSTATSAFEHSAGTKTPVPA